MTTGTLTAIISVQLDPLAQSEFDKTPEAQRAPLSWEVDIRDVSNWEAFTTPLRCPRGVLKAQQIQTADSPITYNDGAPVPRLSPGGEYSVLPDSVLPNSDANQSVRHTIGGRGTGGRGVGT